MPAEESLRPGAAPTSITGVPTSGPAPPRADRGGPVAGILLAAGTSSRMGSNKLLFQLGGESLLRGATRRMLDGGLAPLVVVLGYQPERARQELDGLHCRVVVNPDYEQGITTSLQAGLAALKAWDALEASAPSEPVPASPARIAAAVVLLADMPLVTAGMIAALIRRYRTTNAPLVISEYEGVQAPPMLYDRSLFEELRGMTGGGCGKQVVRRHRGEAEVLAWPAVALADVDVAEDYARMTASMEAGR